MEVVTLYYIMRRGRTACPPLLVVYHCPECWYTEIMDAYGGPPVCYGAIRKRSGAVILETAHGPVDMVPERIVGGTVAGGIGRGTD